MPQVDLAKRRRIMQRSQKLGHCICDPRRLCPCDVFTDQGICPCAGERPEPVDSSQVKLTELVHNAGCASKIAAGDLEAVLGRLPAVDDPAILSGIPAGDDAAIYALGDGVTLVQTVDVFTPSVDDAYTFGRICATNCLSDIYAMGGVPRTALSIVGFPSERLDGQIMYQMIKGAMDTFADADVALIGGHSINDEEIKLGFAITGTTDPAEVIRHDTATLGDALVLTKPLGVGVLNFSRQIGRIGSEQMAAAEASMAILNKAAAEAIKQVGVSACTDITGFGLFGHLIEMARHSGVTAQVCADALPAFDGAIEAIRDGVIPGANERNREHVADSISVAEEVDEVLVELGFDAQTSGGLLIAVPEKRRRQLLDALGKRGVSAATIGKIVEASAGRILVTLSGQDASAAPEREIVDELPHPEPAKQEAHSEACCADVLGEAEAPKTSAEASRAFGALMRATSAAGAIDEKTKELINFALVILTRCRPCVEIHLKKARKMGLSQPELDEAAWCAVAMGGAPVKMFYQAALETERKTEGDACCD